MNSQVCEVEVNKDFVNKITGIDPNPKRSFDHNTFKEKVDAFMKKKLAKNVKSEEKDKLDLEDEVDLFDTVEFSDAVKSVMHEVLKKKRRRDENEKAIHQAFKTLCPAQKKMKPNDIKKVVNEELKKSVSSKTPFQKGLKKIIHTVIDSKLGELSSELEEKNTQLLQLEERCNALAQQQNNLVSSLKTYLQNNVSQVPSHISCPQSYQPYPQHQQLQSYQAQPYHQMHQQSQPYPQHQQSQPYQQQQQPVMIIPSHMNMTSNEISNADQTFLIELNKFSTL
jgi:hypothetical protein